MATSTHADARWRERRVSAAIVDGLTLAIPIAVAILTVFVVSSMMPPPQGALQEVIWWLIVGLASGLALFVSERQARRLLPLTTLLRLSMAFPDHAPSRFAIALRAGTVRDLEHRLAHVTEEGLHEEPAQAASTILTLASALSSHDRRTRGHSERVRAFTDMLAAEMGLSEDDRDRLRWSALLHDIGKLQVEKKILNKDGPLNHDEWHAVHRHPEVGAKVTEPLRHWLGSWSDTIEQHHENFDGSGYPNGLAGDEICEGARMVAVADAFEVMTALRSYKRPMDAAAARKELTRCAGAQFDPGVVRAFLNLSLGQLAWVIGPVAWLASLRFVRGAIHVRPRLVGLLRASIVLTSFGALAAILVTPGTAGYKAEADSLPVANGTAPLSAGLPALARLFGGHPSATTVAGAAGDTDLADPLLAASPWSSALARPELSRSVDPAPADTADPAPAADPSTVPAPSATPAPAPPAPPAADQPQPATGDDKTKPPADKPAPRQETKGTVGEPDPVSGQGDHHDDGDDESGPDDNDDNGDHGNSDAAHDHSHDAECGNHGAWVSSKAHGDESCAQHG
ncbi:MAG: hypothetical protein QOG64_3264 [Acidimicrobiaceae bacterium]|nr:hypothetical protein [Acidimicrobiaceae bacterium]